jgi:hypothetical protein
MSQKTAKSPAGDKSAGLRAQTSARLLRIRRIRELIRGGEYENDLKLSVAAERLLGELDKRRS